MADLALVHRVRPATDGSAPFPGLLLLHGLGSNEADLFALAPGLDSRLVVVSARAPLAYRWGGYMWFDLERHGADLGSESIEHALETLDQFVAQIVDTYQIDAHRLFVGGFSMGASMAGAFSLLHPERVAGAIMASGFLPPDPDHRYRTGEASGLPVFQAHGTADPVVPIDYARLTRDYFEGTPVDLTYREYPIGHYVSPEELSDLTTWLAASLDRPG